MVSLLDYPMTRSPDLDLRNKRNGCIPPRQAIQPERFVETEQHAPPLAPVREIDAGDGRRSHVNAQAGADRHLFESQIPDACRDAAGVGKHCSIDMLEQREPGFGARQNEMTIVK